MQERGEMMTSWTAEDEETMSWKEFNDKFPGQIDTFDSTVKSYDISDLSGLHIPDEAVVYIEGFGFSISYSETVTVRGEERKMKRFFFGTIKSQ